MNWIIIMVFVAVGLIIYRKKKFSHPKTVHSSPSKSLEPYDNEKKNYYHIGQFKYDTQLTFGQKFSRKKINNYLFMVDGVHKIEIALIDLGYAKVLNANYFAEGETFSFEEKVGFKLDERFDVFSTKINKSHNGFKLKFERKQVLLGRTPAVQTTFDILITRKGGEFSLDLTHVQPDQSCVTYIREGVVSYKGYGGQGTGSVRLLIDQNGKKVDKKLTLTNQNTVTGFDGFRASGWEWKWVWGMGSGIDSIGRRFSINMGSINQISEDFLYIGDNAFKISKFDYVLSEDTPTGETISFKSSSPALDLTFKITAKEHKYQDMVLLKSDMVKFQGYWSGTYTDPQTQESIQIEHLPGLVEAADSIF